MVESLVQARKNLKSAFMGVVTIEQSSYNAKLGVETNIYYGDNQFSYRIDDSGAKGYIKLREYGSKALMWLITEALMNRPTIVSIRQIDIYPTKGVVSIRIDDDVGRFLEELEEILEVKNLFDKVCTDSQHEYCLISFQIECGLPFTQINMIDIINILQNQCATITPKIECASKKSNFELINVPIDSQNQKFFFTLFSILRESYTTVTIKQFSDNEPKNLFSFGAQNGILFFEELKRVIGSSNISTSVERIINETFEAMDAKWLKDNRDIFDFEQEIIGSVSRFQIVQSVEMKGSANRFRLKFVEKDFNSTTKKSEVNERSSSPEKNNCEKETHSHKSMYPKFSENDENNPLILCNELIELKFKFLATCGIYADYTKDFQNETVDEESKKLAGHSRHIKLVEMEFEAKIREKRNRMHMAKNTRVNELKNTLSKYFQCLKDLILQFRVLWENASKYVEPSNNDGKTALNVSYRIWNQYCYDTDVNQNEKDILIQQVKSQPSFLIQYQHDEIYLEIRCEPYLFELMSKKCADKSAGYHDMVTSLQSIFNIITKEDFIQTSDDVVLWDTICRILNIDQSDVAKDKSQVVVLWDTICRILNIDQSDVANDKSEDVVGEKCEDEFDEACGEHRKADSEELPAVGCEEEHKRKCKGESDEECQGTSKEQNHCELTTTSESSEIPFTENELEVKFENKLPEQINDTVGERRPLSLFIDDILTLKQNLDNLKRRCDEMN